MKEMHGLWWPEMEGEDIEPLFRHMLRRVTDVDVAMRYVMTKGVAVQAGGFNGWWARRLAKFFEIVYTFEPVKQQYDCLLKNTASCPGVIATQCLLGPQNDARVQFAARRGGRTRVTPDGADNARQLAIDELDLVRCDAIYLDVEGYELDILRGAKATMQRFKPVVTLEVKETTHASYDDYMLQRGYRVAEQVHGDVVYVPVGK